MRRAVAVVLALVLVQALLVGGWWLVERGWAPAAELTPADRPAPTLSYLRRDGSPATLGAADEPVVVHFWAPGGHPAARSCRCW